MNKIVLVWYYVEVLFSRILNFLNIKRSEDCIPKGMYCYEYDKERNEKEPCNDGGYWIKTCKYYRSTPETGGIACTYVGFFGFEPSLYDQCKICSVKNNFKDED